MHCFTPLLYNSDSFHVPMLVEEFARVGIDLPEEGTRFLNVLKIERKVNSHRLGEAFKRYTGKSLDDTHDALSDISTTDTIFKKQLERNPTLPTSIPDIESLCRGDYRHQQCPVDSLPRLKTLAKLLRQQVY